MIGQKQDVDKRVRFRTIIDKHKNFALLALLATGALLLILVNPAADNNASETLMTPASSVEDSRPPQNEVTFSSIGNNGLLQFSEGDIQVLATEVIETQQMVPMFAGASTQQIDSTVASWSNAFNQAWQTGNQPETYKYGALLKEAADGNTEAKRTVESYVWGWKLTIYGNTESESIQTLDYTWLLNAMHAITALGERETANKLFMYVVTHPQLESNKTLYNTLVAQLGPQMLNIRQALAADTQAQASRPNQETTDNHTQPAYEPFAEGNATEPPTSIAETQFANTQPTTSQENPQAVGATSGTSYVRIEFSPAAYVIMARDIWNWLNNDPANAHYTVLSEHYAKVTLFGKEYETPFLLVTVLEERGNKSYEHTFLLVWEMQEPGLTLRALLDQTDGVTTLADLVRKFYTLGD